jgi:hypothetical protein
MYQRFETPLVPSKAGVWGWPGDAGKPLAFRVNALHPAQRRVQNPMWQTLLEKG